MGLFAELQRRNVFRAALAYLIAAWVVLQISQLVLEAIEAPSWVIKVFLLVFALGLPLTLLFSWAFEITPEGIKREKDVDRSQSITPDTGRKLDIATIVVVVLVGVLVLWQQFVFTPTQSPDGVESPVDVVLSPQPRPAPEPAAPDNSIAVLAFTNMSSDKEQEFFADGLSDTLIHVLAQVSGLKVTAKTSSFYFKGMNIKVGEIARELNVATILEGSVQKSGDRIRVIAQLINAADGTHLWSMSFDRDLQDIFAIQDEITREIVVALEVRLSAGEQARIWSSGTKNLEAWECVRQGMNVLDRGTQESVRECLRLCKRALDVDPNYAMAWVTLGWAHHHGVDVGLGHALEESRKIALGTVLDCGKKALELDPSCADAYCLLSFCHLSKDEYDEAIAMSQKAVALAPSHAEILALSANVQNKSGRPERGLELIKKAMRLCPIYPGWYFELLGTAYRLTGDTSSAITAFETAIKNGSDMLSMHVNLAVTLGELGRREEAQTPVAEIQRLDPDFSIKRYMEGLSYRDPAELARFEKGLREAGLPE